MNKLICFIPLYLALIVAIQAQSMVGKWKTIDDQTGNPRSVVEIYERQGKFYGSVVKLFRSPDENPDPVCDECTDYRKNQKIIGMEIISGMEYDQQNKEYQHGEILDPENGNIYDCKLWVDENGHLKVRGYLYFLYRTQTWLPYSNE